MAPITRVALILAMLTAGGRGQPAEAAPGPQRPNIVFILGDDVGYGDLGCYGQRLIATPNLDRLAGEGLRFTQHYAANTVCGPSRSCLLTGLHSGHARHRGNDRFVDTEGFRPGDVTFAEVVHAAGYATAICGKWHLGDRAGTKDTPDHHGFDLSYCPGYPYPAAGREHWPSHVFVNGRQTPIPENAGGAKVRYMDDLYTDAALEFMPRSRDRPFLLYLSFQGVHAPIDGRVSGRYAATTWPPVEQGFASMLQRVDENVGRVLAALQEMGLAEKTVVFFSSDNGGHLEGGHDVRFFHSVGPLRGAKRDLYEGGIRVPLIVRWPGVVPPGTTTEHVCAGWDMLPTFTELAGGALPPKVDGVSLVPLLRGAPPPGDRMLYWETREKTRSQAARWGRWKAVRTRLAAFEDPPLELYDLRVDPAEAHDVAAQHADIVATLRRFMAEAHEPALESPLFLSEQNKVPSRPRTPRT